MSSLIARERADFHHRLIESGTLAISPSGVASNADRSQQFSQRVALSVARALGAREGGAKLDGQRAGKNFEEAVSRFVADTFTRLQALRPGDWEVRNVGGTRHGQILAGFEPYRHLDELAEAVSRNPTLAAVLGNSYDISPDVVVLRAPVPDSVINRDQRIVDASVASLSPLRAENQSTKIVHAVVSCKWTLRSDRAQNARSEALNLIRNRKGRTPHIVVATAEPTPSRLASLALGTGDIDTIYHFALHELHEAVSRSGNEEAIAILRTLVTGKRLRDISDLPLDLAV